MTRDSAVQLLAVLALASCLAGSGVVATQITGSAGRHKLAYTQRAEESDPPQVSLGIAMGAFRGVFVNWLWLRANALKEAGRFYEANELASAITRLQPRYPHVWAFHAWNMAYNISVSTNTAQERWAWVMNGINLLRNEGIPANPNDLLLHKELAYIFNHKVQGYMDDANWYYKRQIALEWTSVLGEPPKPDPRMKERDQAIRRYVEWLRPIADAPDNPAELTQREPAARAVIDRLREVSENVGRGGVNAPFILMSHALCRALARSGQRAVIEASMPDADKKFLAIVEDPSLARGWDALLAYLRRRTLIDQYHMEPDRMVRYTEQYGPLDWRHASAHSLYWAARGVEQALTRVGEENEKDFDFVNTDRMVVQAIQELWRSGEVYVDFLGGMLNPDRTDIFYTVMPNVHFTDTYGGILDDLRKRSSFDEEKDAFSIYSAGYENFLIDATRFFFRRGQRDVAAGYFERARTDPHFNLNAQDRTSRFAKSLEEFVWDETVEEYTRPDIARLEVTGALQGAYVSGLLTGDLDLFQSQFEFAAKAHGFFFGRQGRATQIDPDMMRMELMPGDFALMAADQFVRLIDILDLDDAETLYNNAPIDIRRFGYDRIREQFGSVVEQLQKDGGRAFGAIFPEPDGMDEHRRDMQQRQSAEDRRRLQLEQK